MCVSGKITNHSLDSDIKLVVVFKDFANWIFISIKFLCRSFCKYCLVGFAHRFAYVALHHVHIKDIKKFRISHHQVILFESLLGTNFNNIIKRMVNLGYMFYSGHISSYIISDRERSRIVILTLTKIKPYLIDTIYSISFGMVHIKA